MDGHAVETAALVDVEAAEEALWSFHSVQASQEAGLIEKTQEVVEGANSEAAAEGTPEVEGVEAGASEVPRRPRAQDILVCGYQSFLCVFNGVLVD